MRAPEAPEPAQQSARQVLLARALGHPGLLVSGAILAAILVAALLAPWIVAWDPYDQLLDRRVMPPPFLDSEQGSWTHPLGTDNLGRDYLSRVVHGARISLLIGFFAMVVSGVIGTTMGLLAGYFGGRVDMVVTFFITTRLSLPAVMVALAVVAIVGGSLFVMVTVLGFLLWDRFAVVIRSATMQVRSLEFVAAAEAVGCSTGRIVFSEVLPNVMSSLIVIATFEMAQAILLEAALSFLGLGVQPPLPSWGLMVAEAREFLLFDPWMIMVPGAAIFVLVLAINLLGDGIRDVTAPENRN